MTQRQPGDDDAVVVVGIAARYPEADDLAEFRANLAAGRDSVRPLSRSRAEATGLGPPSDYQPMGFVEDIATFDYSFFTLSKREASLIDPQQRLALVLAYRAIEEAGYSATDFRDSATAVIFSAATSTYPAMWAEPGVLSTLGNVPFAVPARIAYQLGLTGPCYAVDSGCNGSLIAVHHACRELRSGDADFVLAGGVSLRVNGIRADLAEGSAELMSPGGRCRAFDASADGTAVGEGGAALLLTTMGRARADRVPVHAVIRGTATVSSGHSSATISSPSARAQVAVIERAWRNAGLAPSDAGYLEAHGSGTPLGDAVELEGIASAFEGRSGVLPIGSVKTNIGHLDHAAGVSGLVKAILAVEHGELYPSLHFDKPTGGVDFAGSGIEVVTEARTWSEEGSPRRAGVSSFSLGGINAHCVVEQPPRQDTAPRAEDTAPRAEDTAPRAEDAVPRAEDTVRLVGVSAKSVAALATLCDDLASAVRGYHLADIVFTLNQGRPHHEYRVAVQARTVDELAKALAAQAADPEGRNESAPTRRAPSVALLLSPDPMPAALRGRSLPPGLPATGDEADLLAGQIAVHRELRNAGVSVDAVLSGGVSRYAARYLLGTLSEVTASEIAAAAADPAIDTGRFVAVAKGMLADGPVVFVEPSPDGQLGRLLADALGDRADAEILRVPDTSGAVTHVLAGLYERGVDLDWAAVGAADETARRVRLPGHPMLGSRCWYDLPGRPEWGRTPEVVAPEPNPEPAPLPPVDSLDWLQTTLRGLLHSETAVAADDDYFELGGNSLIAMQLVDKVAEQYGVRPKLIDLYERPKVADFAELLAAGTSAAGGLPPITPRGRHVMSFGQVRMWFHHQLDATTTIYNLPMVSDLHGPIDESAVRGMWDDLAARHQVLLSNYVNVDGEPQLRIRPSLGDFFRTADVSNEPDPVAAARALVHEAAIAPFDLANDPLVRALLVRIGPDEHVLQVTTHHSVNDGGSPRIFERELPALYAARRTGRPADLPPLSIQYWDYALWQRELIASAALEPELDYWRQVLADVPLLRLPTDFPRPERKNFTGAFHTFTISAEQTARLRAVARRESVSLFVVLLSAFFLLIASRSRQRDIVVGTPTTGRNRPELAGMIGYFNSTVALRADLSGEPSLTELFGRVRDIVLGALEHQEIPFDRVVTALTGDRDTSRTPLFDVCHVHQELPALQAQQGLTETLFDQEDPSAIAFGGVPSGTAKFDLTLVTTERGGEDDMAAGLEFSTELFTEQTAAALCGEYVTILAGIVDSAAVQPISALLPDSSDEFPSRDLPIAPPVVPADRPRPTSNGAEPLRYSIARVTATLDDAPGFAELLAAWIALLAWYTAQDEVVVGTAAAPGGPPRLVGVDLSGEPSFLELVSTVRRELSSESSMRDSAAVHFPVRCDGERAPSNDRAEASSAELALAWSRGQSPNLTLELDYAVELFDRSTATAMLADLRQLIRALVTHPDLPAQEVAMEYVHQDDTGLSSEAAR
ncbi:condensation domain-containing protein [Rhodococcus oxybenzonivorans]|uniref:condensation domain-containing protein n=1 Tax=Rhodococcus oxybenzonivorans TaxID=1990687 RepID=UPI002954A1E8|nr:condensation domain-containing protein [Rhodococcus oxybenzonivorans]MDV7356860.1 condensation domain-containing protein [Rhodococcus oxybenzonivorans]